MGKYWFFLTDLSCYRLSFLSHSFNIHLMVLTNFLSGPLFCWHFLHREFFPRGLLLEKAGSLQQNRIYPTTGFLFCSSLSHISSRKPPPATGRGFRILNTQKIYLINWKSVTQINHFFSRYFNNRSFFRSSDCFNNIGN